MSSWQSEFLPQLGRWYTEKIRISWRQEIYKLRHVHDKNVWIALCIIFNILLIPYLGKEAFSDSFLLGLSFLWSTFLAVSFAYILRHPLLLILVYVGVIFGREVINSIANSAKEAVIAGDTIGAIILFFFGAYLIKWANDMKTGAIFLEPAPAKKSPRKTSRKSKSGYRRRR